MKVKVAALLIALAWFQSANATSVKVSCNFIDAKKKTISVPLLVFSQPVSVDADFQISLYIVDSGKIQDLVGDCENPAMAPKGLTFKNFDSVQGTSNLLLAKSYPIVSKDTIEAMAIFDTIKAKATTTSALSSGLAAWGSKLKQVNALTPIENFLEPQFAKDFPRDEYSVSNGKKTTYTKKSGKTGFEDFFKAIEGVIPKEVTVGDKKGKALLTPIELRRNIAYGAAVLTQKFQQPVSDLINGLQSPFVKGRKAALEVTLKSTPMVNTVTISGGAHLSFETSQKYCLLVDGAFVGMMDTDRTSNFNLLTMSFEEGAAQTIVINKKSDKKCSIAAPSS